MSAQISLADDMLDKACAVLCGVAEAHFEQSEKTKVEFKKAFVGLDYRITVERLNTEDK